MKCDECGKVFEQGETVIQGIGSFDQPLFWCSVSCKARFQGDSHED